MSKLRILKAEGGEPKVERHHAYLNGITISMSEPGDVHVRFAEGFSAIILRGEYAVITAGSTVHMRCFDGGMELYTRVGKNILFVKATADTVSARRQGGDDTLLHVQYKENGDD